MLPPVLAAYSTAAAVGIDLSQLEVYNDDNDYNYDNDLNGVNDADWAPHTYSRSEQRNHAITADNPHLHHSAQVTGPSGNSRKNVVETSTIISSSREQNQLRKASSPSPSVPAIASQPAAVAVAALFTAPAVKVRSSETVKAPAAGITAASITTNKDTNQKIARSIKKDALAAAPSASFIAIATSPTNKSSNYIAARAPTTATTANFTTSQTTKEVHAEVEAEVEVEVEEDTELVCLRGGERAWEPVLLVDTREKDYNLIQTRMIEAGICCEVVNALTLTLSLTHSLVISSPFLGAIKSH
jgi:hypothetical protein